jgi:AraC-like DNA-binding protein
VEERRFRDTGPIRQCLVVFPRTTVWIRHAGAREFLADPTLVTIYNRGQLYERLPASRDGDRCDWFAVDDELAREIAGGFDRSDGERERPFRFSRARSSAALYLRQRELLRRAAFGRVSHLELDEEVMAIVAAALALAHGQDAEPGPAERLATRRHRELVERARMELTRDPARNAAVHEIAAAVGASPFHLCRTFRRVMGRTLHAYRRELRVRLALEPLGEGTRSEGGGDSLSLLAYRLGYASHAHLTKEFRRHLGATPSAVRRQLRLG